MKTLAFLLLVLSAIPNFAYAVQVKFLKTYNFSEADKEKIVQIGADLEEVVNSAEFKNRVMEAEFIDLSELSNQEIYDKVMAQDFEYQLELYNPPFWNRRGTIGYTSPSDPIIHLNRWYFDRLESSEVAANLAHEWMHKIGFDHDRKATRRRPYSVPYMIGEIVGELYLQNNPELVVRRP